VIDDVGTLSAIAVMASLVIGFLSAMKLGWIPSVLLGAFLGWLVIYFTFMPANPIEIALSAAYCAFPALIGAALGKLVKSKTRKN